MSHYNFDSLGTCCVEQAGLTFIEICPPLLAQCASMPVCPAVSPSATILHLMLLFVCLNYKVFVYANIGSFFFFFGKAIGQ